MSRGIEATIEHELELIRLAVRVARAEHRAGKRSEASLRDLEERATRDEYAIRALFRGVNRKRGN